MKKNGILLSGCRRLNRWVGCGLIIPFGIRFFYSQSHPYCWIVHPDSLQARVYDITVPDGYQRVSYPDTSFQSWLQQFPVDENKQNVCLYNGSLKSNQNAHDRILDIDAGTRDLQQCADAVIRMRAEYLFCRKRFYAIHFNFTSGHRAGFLNWAAGFRPRVAGASVTWLHSAEPDTGYQNFRRYLNIVFAYAGSYSLAKEMNPIPPADIQPGDVFIQGGFPGHAVIVMDVAKNTQDNTILFLLAQSYMPAQDIHLLKNPGTRQLSPWYQLKATVQLRTPEWTFEWEDLKRFE